MCWSFTSRLIGIVPPSADATKTRTASYSTELCARLENYGRNPDPSGRQRDSWVIPLALAVANPRSQAHILGMVTIVQCNCGAEYRRTEEKFLVLHTGDAICTVCGAALESWSESTHVPIYELIARPDRKPE